MMGGQAFSSEGLGRHSGIQPTGTPSKPVFFDGTPTPADNLGCVISTPTPFVLKSFSNTSYNRPSNSVDTASQLLTTHSVALVCSDLVNDKNNMPCHALPVPWSLFMVRIRL